MKIRISLILLVIFWSLNLIATPKKFLFDATKYETAGNADWVIDEDNHVALRYPTPLQSTITSTTPETYWTGGISSWGISLVQLGHIVESLPVGTAITYGNTSNPQDLANYDVFIVDEPNSPFTAAEKTAIISFVQHGGGLFMISDHVNADRNGDGWDALTAWNNLMRTNSFSSLPFGFKFDSVDVSPSSTNVLTTWSSNPVLNGPQGAVSQLIFHNGATMTIYPSINANVKGLIWTQGVTQGTTNIICASSTYGTGRVVALGDSSPADDGTGSSGHTLYSSWLTEAGGNHARLHLNASLWLAKVTGTTNVSENTLPVGYSLSQNDPNPFNPSTIIRFQIKDSKFVTLKVYDLIGREVSTLVNEKMNAGAYEVNFDGSGLSTGVYFYRLVAGDFVETKKMSLIK